MEDEKNQNVDTQTATEKEEKQNTQNSETKNKKGENKQTMGRNTIKVIQLRKNW